MFSRIERPFMEKPFVPEQGNDPPEVPDEGLAAHHPGSDPAAHMVIAQTPVPKINIVEKDIVQGAQDEHLHAPEPKSPPRILVGLWRHVIKIMMPNQKRDEGEPGDFGGVVPEKPGRNGLVPGRQMVDDVFHG